MKGNCNENTGKLKPVVNFNKCEGKGPCVKVCPYFVFEIQKITTTQFSELSFLGKLKTSIHGKEKAIVINADACHSCGLCITACPENAIRLVKI